MSFEYVITFHTHYEALVCKRKFENMNDVRGAVFKLIPVPREISSSCGTALMVNVEEELGMSFFDVIEYDQVFASFSDGTYSLLKEC